MKVFVTSGTREKRPGVSCLSSAGPGVGTKHLPLQAPVSTHQHRSSFRPNSAAAKILDRVLYMQTSNNF